MIDQNSQFMAILTAVGEAKQANASAMGIPWTFSQMGVGDANGTDPQPDRAQTKLIHEQRRAPLNQVSIDPKNTNVIIAEQVIPETVGGWWIREIGLYDADGDLVAVANCAPSYKPQMAQGSGKTQVVRINFIVTSAANVTLKIDPSVVLATRKYVDDRLIEVLPPTRKPGSYTQVTINKYGVVTEGSNPETLAENGIKDAYTKEQIDGALKLKATLLSPALTGKPTAPTAALGTNDSQLANTAFVQAVVAAVIGGAPGALDTLKELAAALGGDPNFANTIINALAGKADKATTLAGYGILDGMPLGEGCWGSRITALYTDIKAITKTGFTYQIPTGGTLNGFGGAAGSVLTAYSPNSGWQIYIRDNVFMFRGHTGGEWSADLNVWHSGNFNPANYPIKATTLAGYGITDAYTVTAADALLKLKASLASPALTGKPTAPTAALGTNDSQLANTAFVQAAIAAVISGAPGALDTLKELADALGGDPNFANTIVNGLAGKANKGEVMPLGEGGWGRVVGTESIDMKAIGKTCFTYQNPGGGTLNGMGPAAGTVLHAESSGAGWQMYIRGQSFLFRSYLGSDWSETFAAWHSGNLDPNTIFPVGTSIDFAGPVAPAGFLKENGAAVSRATYARLFEVIGTRYGAGNGSTTFNLPDSRGEVFRGLDDGRGVDPGRGLGSIQLDQVQGMKYQMPWGQGAIVSGGAFGGNDLRRYSVATTLDQVEGPLSDGVNGTPRIGAETRMRNVARLKCIKY